MENIHFEYKPELPKFVFKLVWVITLVMIPAGIAIYYTEGRDITRLIFMIGAGIGMPALMYGFLVLTNKFINKNAVLQITDKVIRVVVAREQKELPLEGIESIEIRPVMGSMISLKIIQKSGETLNFALPGHITGEHIGQLRNALAHSKITVR